MIKNIKFLAKSNTPKPQTSNNPNQTPYKTSIMPFAKHDNLDASKIYGEKLEVKDIKNDPGKKYKTLPLKYDYGTMKSSFQLQLPKVSCAGIKLKGQTEDTWVINVRIDKVAHADFINRLEASFKRICEILYEQRMAAGGNLKFFDVDRPEVSSFKNLFFYPTNKDTGEPMTDQNPFMQIKLIKIDNEEKSLFTDLKKKPIKWSLLKGVNLEVIPLISINSIYIGVNPSIQIKLVNAVVCKAVKSGTVSVQDEATNEYLLENPNADEELDEQLARLSNTESEFTNMVASGGNSGFSNSSVVENSSQLQDFLESKPSNIPEPSNTSLTPSTPSTSAASAASAASMTSIQTPKFKLPMNMTVRQPSQ